MQTLCALVVLVTTVSTATAAPGDCSAAEMMGTAEVSALCKVYVRAYPSCAPLARALDLMLRAPVVAVGQTCMTDGCAGTGDECNIDFVQGSCLPWNVAGSCSPTDSKLLADCLPTDTCPENLTEVLSQPCLSCGYGNALRTSSEFVLEIFESCHTTEDKTSGVALAAPVVATLVVVAAMV
eukprot:COSAG02_NODE_577_length_20095_cov_6.816413_22_plen_181_part_00